MVNPHDIACEIKRLRDEGWDPEDAVREMHRLFPTAARADHLMAALIDEPPPTAVEWLLAELGKTRS